MRFLGDPEVRVLKPTSNGGLSVPGEPVPFSVFVSPMGWPRRLFHGGTDCEEHSRREERLLRMTMIEW